MAVKVKSDDIRIYPASQRDKGTNKFGNNLLTEYNISSETKKLLSSNGFVISPSLDRDDYDDLLTDTNGQLTQIFEFNIYGYNVEVKLQAIQDAINNKTLESGEYGEDFVYFTVDNNNVISANITIITSDSDDDSWAFLGGTEDQSSSLTEWESVNIYIDGNLTPLDSLLQKNISLPILKCKQEDGAYKITDIYEDSHLQLVDVQNLHIKSSNGETIITDDELKHKNLTINGDYDGTPTFTIQSKVVTINGSETDLQEEDDKKGKVNIVSDDEINLTSDKITLTETEEVIKDKVQETTKNLIVMTEGKTTINSPFEITEAAPTINISASNTTIIDEEGNEKETGVVDIKGVNKVNITSNDEINIESNNEVNIESNDEINIESNNEIQETSKEIGIEGTDKIELKSDALIDLKELNEEEVASEIALSNNGEIQETAYNTITLDVGDINTNVGEGEQEYFITELQLHSGFDIADDGQEYIKLTSNNINITGNDEVVIAGATTIDGTMKVPTATSSTTSYTVSNKVGDSNQPIYLQNGIFTSSNSTIGSIYQPIYMENGNLTESTGNVGSANQPIYMSGGVLSACTLGQVTIMTTTLLYRHSETAPTGSSSWNTTKTPDSDTKDGKTTLYGFKIALGGINIAVFYKNFTDGDDDMWYTLPDISTVIYCDFIAGPPEKDTLSGSDTGWADTGNIAELGCGVSSEQYNYSIKSAAAFTNSNIVGYAFGWNDTHVVTSGTQILVVYV